MKTVFITGGSRGIGAEAVRTFKNKGYNVAFTYYKSGEQALSLAKETGALAVFCDVSNSEAVNSAIKVAKEAFGSIDILINNAGIDEFALFTDITDEMWHKMIDTNLSSAFFASRSVLPDMINKKDGIIINISSMWGEVGASCEVHYSVSKAGLIGLTKALAKEVAPSGIRLISSGTLNPRERHSSIVPYARRSLPQRIAVAPAARKLGTWYLAESAT